MDGGGSSYCSGGCGAVFEVTPPAKEGGAWSEQVLHGFTGQNGDGGGPSGVVVGPNGAVYGCTYVGGNSNFGTVYELDPPTVAGRAWTETILHSFVSGEAGCGATPAIGQNGILYGAGRYAGTYGGGDVFQLAPPSTPGGTWVYSVLYNFRQSYAGGTGMNPEAGVVLGTNGALYGTTTEGGSNSCRIQGRVEGCGTAFELMPPAAPNMPWTVKVLYPFTGASAGSNTVTQALAIGKNGALYGITSQTENVFRLTPGAAGGSWTEAILYSFTTGCTVLAFPGPLVVGSSGAIYGTTGNCGTYGKGTVFELTP